jgi:hypothetical protein
LLHQAPLQAIDWGFWGRNTNIRKIKTMQLITIEHEAIETFTNQWPCHGFPDDLDIIQTVFADNGDLVDYELFDHCDNSLGTQTDNPDLDGLALSALFDDAREFATKNPALPNMIDAGYTFAAYSEL